jgi:hypothetical protein
MRNRKKSPEYELQLITFGLDLRLSWLVQTLRNPCVKPSDGVTPTNPLCYHDELVIVENHSKVLNKALEMLLYEPFPDMHEAEKFLTEEVYTVLTSRDGRVRKSKAQAKTFCAEALAQLQQEQLTL